MWAYESVFYQIYPMGFCCAPWENDGKTVNRIEKDIRKLTDLYNEGYACAEKVLSPYLAGI